MSNILGKAIVLVLNRNWQAINVRTPQEAFCMMATNVATGLEIEGEDHIRPVTWEEWITLPIRDQDLTAPFVVITMRMERPGGMASARDETELKSIIRKGMTDRLTFKEGRDVFGSGTQQDPYMFRKDLVYHDALHAYLHQKGIRWRLFGYWPHGGKPGDWADMVLALDLQAGGNVGGHHAERLLGRAHVDGLPVAVQHQHGRSRQYSVHKLHTATACGSEVFVLC